MSKDRVNTGLRTGYTTGACASAASKAATMILLKGTPVQNVEIPLPNGNRVNFSVHRQEINTNEAMSSVIKDAGDDHDVTNGAEIVAEVSIVESSKVNVGKDPKVQITGGEGVGIVTKPGLAISVGEPAINPVPRRMISEAVREALFDAKTTIPGVLVKISVPHGEEIAKKTLNPRLGIIGGISILGTTGIVKPISEEAWTSTIKISMDVAKAMRRPEIVLSSGRSSERAHQERYGFPEDCYILMGDHVEFSLIEAKKHKFERIHLCVQWAKMTKIAMRMPQTHVRYGIVEPDTLKKFLSELNDQFRELLNKLNNYKFNTAREIFTTIMESFDREDQLKLLSEICTMARLYAESLTEGIPVKVHLASYEGDIIAESS